jgi:4a-hydroxytetrahydrobiopterin dehydratase
MTRVALLAEASRHHPTIVNSMNYVRLELHTHEDGGVVTCKDREFAAAVDGVVGG